MGHHDTNINYALLTAKNVAEILQVREKTIYQWAALKLIPSLKLNGALRFDRDDITEWLDGCKKKASTGYNVLAQARSPRKGGYT